MLLLRTKVIVGLTALLLKVEQYDDRTKRDSFSSFSLEPLRKAFRTNAEIQPNFQM